MREQLPKDPPGWKVIRDTSSSGHNDEDNNDDAREWLRQARKLFVFFFWKVWSGLHHPRPVRGAAA